MRETLQHNGLTDVCVFMGTGFSGSAEEIRFDFEGEDNHPALRARLFNSEGEAVDAVVNLAERLGNQNGGFYFE